MLPFLFVQVLILVFNARPVISWFLRCSIQYMQSSLFLSKRINSLWSMKKFTTTFLSHFHSFNIFKENLSNLPFFSSSLTECVHFVKGTKSFSFLYLFKIFFFHSKVFCFSIFLSVVPTQSKLWHRKMYVRFPLLMEMWWFITSRVV